jgi:histidine triad (HIT) family protein
MVAHPPGEPDQACPFCAIARGEEPSAELICEGSEWVAFFPVEPATPGHTLVIPRAHGPNLWVLEPNLASTLMQAVIRVGRAIETALDPQGMNLITSSGTVAEQSIFHVHLHVVPRWADDGFGPIWPPERTMATRVKQDAAVRIRQACAER